MNDRAVITADQHGKSAQRLAGASRTPCVHYDLAGSIHPSDYRSACSLIPNEVYHINKSFNPFTPKSDQAASPASPEILPHSMKNLAFA